MRKFIAANNMTLDGFCNYRELRLLKIKTFGFDAVTLHYEPAKNKLQLK